MVTCKLWAQTANQLFMISATICHALRMNTNFTIPRKTINPRIWRTYIHHLPKPRPGQSTRNYFKQPGHSFVPIPEQDDITIEGYFQSEKYWYDYKKELAQILCFNHEPANYVAVHVRRGDYLKYPDRFPILPSEYYHSALMHLINQGYNKFFFFSDDIHWCIDNFQNHLEANGIYYHFSEQNDPISDIRLIFNASAFILSNSTFGLFPALLRADNPVVIAPADHRWFGPNGQDMNSPDRLPERFIKL